MDKTVTERQSWAETGKQRLTEATHAQTQTSTKSETLPGLTERCLGLSNTGPCRRRAQYSPTASVPGSADFICSRHMILLSEQPDSHR